MQELLVDGRGYREDDLAWVLRARSEGISVEDLIGDAQKIRAFMDSTVSAERPDWSHVSAMAEVTAERDRARDTAVRLEQLLAEKERNLDEARAFLTTGVLMAVRRHADHTLTEAGQIAIRRAVEHVAEQFGVQL